MVNPELKLCSADDIDRILDLANRIWKPAFRDMLPADRLDYLFDYMYNRERILKQLTSADHRFYLLCLGAVDAGYAQLIFFDDYVKLEKLYIDQKEQGKKLGYFCLTELLRIAKDAGFHEMRLQVNRGNAKAIAFYLKFGFYILESQDFEVGNGHVMDDYVMKMPIR